MRYDAISQTGFTINRQFSNVKEIWVKQLDWAIATSMDGKVVMLEFQ